MKEKRESDPRNVRRLYDDLAHLWHLVSPLEDYLEETELFADLLRKHSEIPLRSLLHLGCGRGHNDFIFKQHFDVTGVDQSEAMLEWARILNPEVEYFPGDMRTVEIKRGFDAITAVDSVDYLFTVEDLEKFFRTAYQHLNPGGVLMFILETTRETFRQNDTIMYTNRVEDEWLTVIENRFDPDVTDTEYEATFVYLYRKGKELEILHDRHLCGLFSLPEVEQLLIKTGFKVETIDYHPPVSALGSLDEFCREAYPLFLAGKSLKNIS